MKQIQEIGGELYHSDQRLDLAALIRDKKYPLFERQDDWSSCAWFYLDRPENGLPALAPVAERIAGL